GPSDAFYHLSFDIDGQPFVGTAEIVGGDELTTITYESAAAIPEPAVWAELILGFVGIGAGIRGARRRADLIAA
ncbi:MAG: hypothetical protein ACRED8_02515, partial [Caulobacteraceae bacterium]